MICRRRALLAVLLAPVAAAGFGCGGDNPARPGPSWISVSPDSAVVETSASQRFEVSSDGGVPDVMWFVGSVRGGTGLAGVVDTSGLFIAPAAVPPDSIAVVTAIAVGDAALSARATVVIRGGAGVPWIGILPADTTLSPGESITFSKEVEGCGTGGVAWSVEALHGGGPDVGSMGSDGSYNVPSSLTGDIRLLVRAAGVGCSDRVGIATVTVVAPAEFKVELEDYTASYNDARGGSFISAYYCSKASGHHMVKGLDYPGEWIEVPLSVPAYGTYDVVLRYAALAGDTLRATVTLEGCAPSPPPEVDFVMDQGAGLG